LRRIRRTWTRKHWPASGRCPGRTGCPARPQARNPDWQTTSTTPSRACKTVDKFGWIPDRAEAQVRAQVHREIVEATKGRGRYAIDTGRGVVSLSRVLPGEIVGGGPNQLASIAGGR